MMAADERITTPWLNLHPGGMSNTLLCSSLVSILWIVSSSLSASQLLSPGISCNRPVQTLIDRQCWGFVLALISYTESSSTLGPSSRHPCTTFLFPEFPAFLRLSLRLCLRLHNMFSCICLSGVLLISRLTCRLLFPSLQNKLRTGG